MGKKRSAASTSAAPAPGPPAKAGKKGKAGKKERGDPPHAHGSRKKGKERADSPQEDSDLSLQEQALLDEGGSGSEGEDGEMGWDFTPVLLQDQRSAEKIGKSPHKMAEDGDHEEFMQWLVGPLALDQFCDDVLEQRPLVVQRPKNRKYYEGWLSRGDIDGLLKSGKMEYKYNIDVVSYTGGQRHTYNENLDGSEGTATAETVWKRFEDDIDAFILQLEGRKHWKLYRPRDPSEILARYSSPNFTQEEIGEPIMEVTLEEGDLLYMPRGLIHQASCDRNVHSLHVTVSTNQFNTWADLLSLAVPQALEGCLNEDPVLRRALPRGYHRHVGVVHSDKETPERAAFVEEAGALMMRVLDQLPLDAAADQMQKVFVQQRLPLPPATLRPGGNKGKQDAPGKLKSSSRVRLVDPLAARLCVEEGAARLYHIMENSREMHMEGAGSDDEGVTEPGMVEFDLEEAPAVEHLLSAFPMPVTIGSIPIDSKARSAQIAQELIDIGLLVHA